jgi:D-glycero-D-manno-heptose 1,7-bisphosphate phosphatase
MDIHRELIHRLNTGGVVIDALYWCPHLPEAKIPDYRIECECRKPKPGMLLNALNDWGIDSDSSFIVGDSMRDIKAGQAAGIKGIITGKPGSAIDGNTPCVADLKEAAEYILEKCAKDKLDGIKR